MKIGHHCDLEPGVLRMPRPDWDYLMHDCQAGWFPPKCPESQKEKNCNRDPERLLDSPKARRPKDGVVVFDEQGETIHSRSEARQGFLKARYWNLMMRRTARDCWAAWTESER